MNDRAYTHTSSDSECSSMASELAKLTRDLAHCCLTKETELYGRFGLTSSEGIVLLAIAEAGSAKPSAIACNLGLARSRLTPLSSSLVSKGFLERRESNKDRRVRELTLTESGRIVAQAAREFRIDFHRRLLEHYSAEEQDRLIGTLTELRQTMDELRKDMTDSPAKSEQDQLSASVQ